MLFRSKGDVPGGTVDKNPPANAGFNPCPGKTRRAVGQLSPRARTTALALQFPIWNQSVVLCPVLTVAS